MYGSSDRSPPLQGKPAVAEGDTSGGGAMATSMEPFSIDDGDSFDDEDGYSDNDTNSSRPPTAPTTTAPRDNNNPNDTTVVSDGRMRWLFGIMGLGTLFPYNAILTCEDYYSQLHPDVGDVAGRLAAYCLTALLLTTALLLPLSTPSSAVVAEGDHRAALAVPRGGRACWGCAWRSVASFLSSPVHRTYVGYTLCLGSLLLLATLQQPSMGLLEASSFLVGVADATSQSGLYVLAASYHRPAYTAAVTLGSAVAGLAVGVLRLLTRGMFDTASLPGLRRGVAVLYVLSSAVIVGCLWALRTVVRDTPRSSKGSEGETQHGIAANGAADIIREREVAGQSPTNGQRHELDGSNGNSERRLQVYWETIRVTWKPTLAAFLNFFITLSLFPGTIASITSFPAEPFHDTGKDDDRYGRGRRMDILSLGDWLPVVLITTFNAADCVGRGLLNIDRLGLARLLLSRRDAVEADRHEGGQDDSFPPSMPRKVLFPYMNVLVWWHCFSRMIFYPLFALCILPGEPHPLISSDLIRIVIVFSFGVTNGFVNSAAFVVAPTMVTGERHRDASSLLLLLSIYLGLTLGSYFGLMVEMTLSKIASAA